MTIAVDYDKTWTEDPAMWREFTALATRLGHAVVMITGRHRWSDDMARGGIPKWIRIIYAGNKLKSDAAREAGVKVDVWIDDMPGTIQPQLVIGDQKL